MSPSLGLTQRSGLRHVPLVGCDPAQRTSHSPFLWVKPSTPEFTESAALGPRQVGGLGLLRRADSLGTAWGCRTRWGLWAARMGSLSRLKCGHLGIKCVTP